MVRNTKPLNAEIGGPLNPEWVEWLMGWPIGWTDSEHSATAKFRLWLHSHGIPCGVTQGANDKLIHAARKE